MDSIYTYIHVHAYINTYIYTYIHFNYKYIHTYIYFLPDSLCDSDDGDSVRSSSNSSSSSTSSTPDDRFGNVWKQILQELAALKVDKSGLLAHTAPLLTAVERKLFTSID